MDAIQSAYSFFENLNLSVTTLVVIALVFSLAFLLSVREAASWFFKIDDLKKDLKRLNEAAHQIESEIASLHEFLAQIRENQPHLNTLPPRNLAAANPQKTQPNNQKEPSSAPSGFPIVH